MPGNINWKSGSGLLPLFLFLFCLFASRMQAQAGSDMVWRNIQTGHFYRVEISSSSVRIIPLAGAGFSADLPIKVDKKGRSHILGKWQNGAWHGFILIETLSHDSVSAYAYVPQNAASAESCNNRTGAVLANMAGASTNQIRCARIELSWEREENITVEQAMAAEQTRAAAEMVARQQPATDSDSTGSSVSQSDSLAGVWVSEESSAVYYKRIELTLRADGTYTKTLKARTSGYGGAGTVGAPSLGGTHSGRWSASGMVVHLSGDGNWPAAVHNLAEFQRVQ